jgi:hypothetical protein
MDIGLECINKLWINSNLVANGSVVKYRDMIFRFFEEEGIDPDVSLSLGFSQKEGIDLSS